MTDPPTQRTALERTWRIAGQVQGVGFRPFVHRVATELGLSGSVRNDPGGVTIRAAGSTAVLDEFAARLAGEGPPLASVREVLLVAEEEAPETGRDFRIVASEADGAERGRVTVDAATCPACLAELHDPRDRRHRHALINCTDCGPRYTIVVDLPYDRSRTTMAKFPMCDACAREYADPADRRFHAQPVCCPECGPQPRLENREGEVLPGDPLSEAARLLDRGGLLAMKGLGGYHLVVDATNERAVFNLRRAKGRDHKPFAVMVADPDAVRRLVDLSGPAEEVLSGPVRPVVLATSREGAGLAPSVAPDCHRTGVMLPSTPLQHLLLAEFPRPVVMTSANRTDDPLIIDDDEARTRLGAFCGGLLLHDREIRRAVDDSVVLDTPRGVLPLRRARGHAPATVSLPIPAPRPGLAVGGSLKGAVAVVRGGEAITGQHLGDLDHSLAYRRFLETVDDLARLFDLRPEWIAADLHPDYPSHRYARDRAARDGIPLVLVQHHHAHLASLLAEHGRKDRVVGVVCDGVGHGTDGEAWGGEILVGDVVSFTRAGRLRPLSLPGGDAAAKETGRCALAWLHDLMGDAAFTHPRARAVLPDSDRRHAVAALLAGGTRCPRSSGLGRLFDAAASLLSLCDRNHYEAMSGMRLEAEATRAGGGPSGEGAMPVTERDGFLEIDHRPLLGALLSFLTGGSTPGEIAWFFHDAVADALALAAMMAAEREGLTTVGLSGGVFCNALLEARTSARLRAAGLTVLIHREVPPNDGGIAIGQAAVAAAQLTARGEEA